MTWVQVLSAFSVFNLAVSLVFMWCALRNFRRAMAACTEAQASADRAAHFAELVCNEAQRIVDNLLSDTQGKPQ